MDQLFHMAVAHSLNEPFNAFLQSCVFPVVVVVGVALGVLASIFGDGGGGSSGSVARGDVNPPPPIRSFGAHNSYQGTNTRRAQPREIIDEIL